MEQYANINEKSKNATRAESKVVQQLLDDIIDVASKELLNEDGSIKKEVATTLLGPDWQKLSKTQIILSFVENLNGAITLKIDEERRKKLSPDVIEKIQSAREFLIQRVQWQWENKPEAFKQYIQERISPVTPTKIEAVIANLDKVTSIMVKRLRVYPKFTSPYGWFFRFQTITC